jgi:hypothetical protein
MRIRSSRGGSHASLRLLDALAKPVAHQERRFLDDLLDGARGGTVPFFRAISYASFSPAAARGCVPGPPEQTPACPKGAQQAPPHSVGT